MNAPSIQCLFLLVVLIVGGPSLSASEILENAPSQPIGLENIQPLKPGAKAPNSAVWNLEGRHVSLKSQWKGKPTLFVFVEGSWNPAWKDAAALLQTIQEDAKASGVQLFLISPEKPEDLPYPEMPAALPVQWISDQNRNAAKAFGVAYHPTLEERALLPKTVASRLLNAPFVFLCNTNGVTLYQGPIRGAEELEPLAAELKKKFP